MTRSVILGILAAFFSLAAKASGEQFQVRANAGQYHGDSLTEKVFPQFEIRVITDDNSAERQPLNSEGETWFNVETSHVRKLEWTTGTLPKYVLWPAAVKVSGQQALPNPCTRFQLFSLKGLWRETKLDAADRIRRGGFDAAEDIFRDVNDIYEPYRADPQLSGDLSIFVHQLYESMSDAALYYRKSARFRALSAEDQTKVLNLERGWHRSMIERYANNTDEGINRRLAATLRRWSEFARATHSHPEWVSESINSAKAKQPASLSGDLSALHEDLDQVNSALFSPALKTTLREKIARNLAPNLRNGPTALEKKQLSCYEDLAASQEKEDFSVDGMRLDDLDRAISAFGYFFHAESGK